MTQLEVPQISLQRYVDLLKRRRWQVIPVSLLGLVIGGIVAFFIPRYYVADTLLKYRGLPDKLDARAEDPFKSLVENARLTIPLAIGETVRELRWREALVDDPSQRTQFEREVERRLVVVDQNQWDRTRLYAQLRLVYKDRDGQRAADFLNQLAPTWVAAELRALREPAEAEQRAAREAVQNQQALYEQLVQENKQLAVDFLIDPSDETSYLRVQLQAEEARLLRDLRSKKEEKEREVAVAQRLLADGQAALDAAEPRVLPDADLLLKLAKTTPEGLQISAQIERCRDLMRSFREGTEQHRNGRYGLELAEAELRRLVSDTIDADGRIANPEFEALQARVTAATTALEVARAELATMQAQLDAEEARLLRRAEGLTAYEKKKAALATAKQDLEAAQARLREANQTVATLSKEQPVEQVGRALVPPRPTDPNILVVAMIGCVLGLGAAIGLILLLDFVQGTFKTIDDVERGVPVPVLGGMSHLETEAERESSVRRRRRVSLSAAAMVAMVVIVVTIFYVDPTRLPPVVRDLLAMLLGT